MMINKHIVLSGAQFCMQFIFRIYFGDVHIPKSVLAGTKRIQDNGRPSWRHAYCRPNGELFSHIYRQGLAKAGTPPSK